MTEQQEQQTGPKQRICPGCKRPARGTLYTAVNPDTGQIQRVCTWCEASWAHRREVERAAHS